MVPKPPTLPGDDCRWLDDDEGISPPGPEPGDPSPEEPVTGSERRALGRVLVDCELVAKSEDLQLHGRSGA
jgi:hypothetical protein